jgi:hypothetical protein
MNYPIAFGTLPGAILHDMEIYRNYSAGLGQSFRVCCTRWQLLPLDRNV